MWSGVATLYAANWGTVPGWATLLALLGVGWIMVRGGTGTAVSGLQATNRELQRQISELKDDVKRLTAENAELRGRTDVALVIEPVVSAVKNHETHAAKRSEAMLDVLDMIATRLGKEHEE